MPMAMVETEVINQAVRLACRAPSLHNSQPWRWQYRQGRLQLFLDAGRVMNSDQSGRQALISCGALLDHFQVAIAAAGWQTTINRFPTTQNPNHLASIDFTRTDQVSDVQRRRADAILLRRTDRLPFLAPTDWESFEPALRSVVEGHITSLEVMPDTLHQQLVDASQLTNSLRLTNTAYYAELAWWTGPFEVSEGIPYPALVTPTEAHRTGIGRQFPAIHHDERRREVPEDHAKVLVLCTANNHRADALASGEALSQTLLECTMAGLATCPVTHLTELAASRALIQALLDRDAMPQILIRVGVAPALDAPPPPTPRRPLSDVLDVC